MSTPDRGFLLRVTNGPDLGTTRSVDRPLTVGRSGELLLADPAVSRVHLRVHPDEDGLVAEDAGSANGFRVNGAPVRSANVRSGDVISVGSSELRVLRLVRHRPGLDEPHLLVDRGDGAVRSRRIDAGAARIGRDPVCEVVIDHPSVSRHHATLHRDGGALVLEDRSRNGTILNGAAVRDRAPVHHGDVIAIGTAPHTLTVDLGEDASGPLRVDVLIEGAPRPVAATVRASSDSTVAEVTLALATALGVADRGNLLYRHDGMVLHPDDRWVDTRPRHADQLVLGAGDATELQAAAGRFWPRPAAPRPTQLPRRHLPPQPTSVALPTPPEPLSWKGRGILWQLVGGLGVVVMALVMVIVRPEFAIFAGMAAVVGIVSIGASILGEQSRRRARARDHDAAIARLDDHLATTARSHRQRHTELSPSTATLAAWIGDVGDRLWERRTHDPDVLRLRVGTGQRTLPVERETTHREPDAATRAVLDRHRTVADCAVTGPRPSDGPLGVCGDTHRRNALLRRLVVEAAALHPPDALQIWVLADDAQWEWSRWLPHTGPDGERVATLPGAASGLLEEVRRDVRRAAHTEDGQLLLIVVPDARALGPSTDLAAWSGERVLTVVSAPTAQQLPSGTNVVVEVDDEGRADARGAYEDGPVGPFAAEGIDELTARSLSLGLARAASAVGAPGGGGITELLGLGAAADVDVDRSWATGPDEVLTVPIGVDRSGRPVTMGFRRDGPHGMIAGTTGSGKSELLQTLLGALALTHPPDLLQLFLIDYKGGATFAPLEGLPHIVGSVTDLENDASLAARAFTALDAEILRRKRLLDEARVPNVIEYAARQTEGEPLANLLVVIDEFALMVKDQPALKERLDTVATQGRSLGIHLLLATQSPTGVITHAVRTNTNLWVCLRVVADSESLELLGTRDAAAIPDGSPGQGFIRLGAGEQLRGFRAARIARPVPDDDRHVHVELLGAAAPKVPSPSGRTELDTVVELVEAAWRRRGRERPEQLWLPPLPDHLGPDACTAATPPDRLVVLLGLADHPEEHAQRPFVVDLSGVGHLAIGGVLGSGKSTTLTQVALDLAERHDPRDLHLYGIDGGAGHLARLTELPHVGDVVATHDVERLTRLIDRLDRLVEARREELAGSGVAGFTAWRATGAPVPWTVVLLDDLAAFRESAEAVEMGRLVGRFGALLQNGPAVGVHLVVTINQQVDLRMREASLIPERLLFRMTDLADYAMVDARIRPGELGRLPPGRGLTAGNRWIQVIESHPERAAAIVERHGATGEGRPRPVPRLPRSLSIAELPIPIDGGTRLVIGVGGDEVEPVGVDLGRGAPVLLVAGQVQSGRSTAVATALEASRRTRPDRARTLVALRHPDIATLRAADPELRVCTDPAELLPLLDELLDAPGPSLVAIDDVDGLIGRQGVGERLDALVRGARDADRHVVLAARTADLTACFESWARYVVSLRRVLLLQPGSDDTMAFGFRGPTVPPPAVAGRGLLLDGAEVVVVQIATT